MNNNILTTSESPILLPIPEYFHCLQRKLRFCPRNKLIYLELK